MLQGESSGDFSNSHECSHKEDASKEEAFTSPLAYITTEKEALEEVDGQPPAWATVCSNVRLLYASLTDSDLVSHRIGLISRVGHCRIFAQIKELYTKGVVHAMASSYRVMGVNAHSSMRN